MSPVSRWAKSKEPLALAVSLTSTPSTSTLTWLALVPRRNTEVGAPGPPDCTTLSPGRACSRSGSVSNCWSWICAEVTTETLLPTWSRGVGIRVAVTVTWLTEVSWAWAAGTVAIRAAVANSSRLIWMAPPLDVGARPARLVPPRRPIGQTYIHTAMPSDHSKSWNRRLWGR